MVLSLFVLVLGAPLQHILPALCMTAKSVESGNDDLIPLLGYNGTLSDVVLLVLCLFSQPLQSRDCLVLSPHRYEQVVMKEPTDRVHADAQFSQLLSNGSHEPYGFQRAVNVAGDHLAWKSVFEYMVFFGQSERCDDRSALRLMENHLRAFLKWCWRRRRGRECEEDKGRGVED